MSINNSKWIYEVILGCKNTNAILKNIRQPTFLNDYITIFPRRPYTKKCPYMVIKK